jgi:hypothetical protein
MVETAIAAKISTGGSAHVCRLSRKKVLSTVDSRVLKAHPKSPKVAGTQALQVSL